MRKPHQKGQKVTRTEQIQAQVANERPWDILGKTKEEWDAMPVNQPPAQKYGSPVDGAPLTFPDATAEFNAQQKEAVARDPELAPPEKPARKPRSDKGVQRPVKLKVEAPAPASGGVLTEAEINHIKMLVDALNSAILASFAAETRTKRASAELNDYLDARAAR